MPRDSPEKNTPRRLFGNSAGYSADSVVACVLPKKMQEVNEMANVKMIAPQTFQPEHMRVAAYCRVSSDSKDQLHSYAAQIRSYTEEIAQHDGWELVDVYADEGLTGTRMDQRDDFNRMMRDCRKGKIDRVLVKSVSRFARNTKDCLSALRELSTLGVSVQFEKENIDTKTLTTELMVSVSGSLAQQESISISANQKISYQRRMERGEFITCSAPYGYRIIDKKNLEIIPEEAATVQWIFDAYLNGRSAEWIAEQLTRRGIENTNTRKPWTAYGIRYILRNEKYVGDALGQKKFTKGFPFFRKRNHGEQEQYYVENTHLPIPYCPEAPLWDKHKVKRLLENPRYTGKDGFPAAVDADTFQAARKKAEEKNALRQPRGGKSPIARLTPYFRCTCGGKLIRIGGKWLDSSELHLKCGSCGSTITTDTDTVLTEANRQIYAHEHPKQPAYAPSAEVIRLSNAINRGLEQPDSPEAVMALILQGAAARYDCCPEPISEYENFDHLPKADWNHFRRVVSYITITQEHIITVQFTDQAGKDE